MNFLVAAIDHNWQSASVRHEGQEILEKKERLSNFVKQAIAIHKIDLICEESNAWTLSIAQKIAYENDPRILWRNIDMTAQERLEAGIWEALIHRPVEIIDTADPPIYLLCRIPEDDLRERFFTRKCIDVTNETAAKSGLVLCGDMHVDVMAQHLNASGFEVKINRSLVPVKNWK